MNEILYFFTNISDETRVFLLVSGITFFLILETGIPFVTHHYDKLSHAGINITFTLITLFLNLFGAMGILKAVEFNRINNFGLLNIIQIPLWLYILLGIILMDFFGAWLIHWIQHNVRWMWRFHIIHHSDPNVDVTSGLRHHPGENIFRLCFTILAVLITGANFGLVMMYQTVSAFFAHFSHANIRTLYLFEYFLSYIFVTPEFHKVHHHYVQPHTDSNYGNIFSFWDHVFRTVTKFENSHEIIYGVDTHMDSNENSSIKNLLMIPFQSHRSPKK